MLYVFCIVSAARSGITLKTYTEVGSVEAVSEAEALGLARHYAEKRYPRSTGWKVEDVKVQPASETINDPAEFRVEPFPF